ncbi:MAG: acyl-CoA dehydrogenase family protein [Clostridiales Family XIII bacterium]|jgi:alkylation response protein AidB-like acyl-CoA dehydrogenase|nr:acyl-CoA dehydrogenase family protein [Clostridiales Family XIII bacterium]
MARVLRGNRVSGPFFETQHELVRKLARDFAERELAPTAQEFDETETFPAELYKLMGRAGFFGIKIPREYGGAGADTRAYALTMEELSRGNVCAGVLVSGANSLGTAPLLLVGTEEQKRKYLPEIASGESFMAFGLTEPDAGSDAGSMKMRASEDGGSYILNGTKTFITGAPFAKWITVFAKTNPAKGAKGITSFFVDMDAPGVSLGRNEHKMGQRAIPTSDVILEDVRVPKSAILGEIDKGFVTAMRTLSVGRIGVASQALGVAQNAVDLAIPYMKSRKQFGKTLSAFQGLQFMLAEMETKLNAARLLIYHAAYEMDMGRDATKAASMAKYYATEACLEIVNGALQMFGGYGYSRDYPIERLYRDARVMTIYEGTTQVQQMVISGQLLR